MSDAKREYARVAGANAGAKYGKGAADLQYPTKEDAVKIKEGQTKDDDAPDGDAEAQTRLMKDFGFSVSILISDEFARQLCERERIPGADKGKRSQKESIMYGLRNRHFPKLRFFLSQHRSEGNNIDDQPRVLRIEGPSSEMVVQALMHIFILGETPPTLSTLMKMNTDGGKKAGVLVIDVANFKPSVLLLLLAEQSDYDGLDELLIAFAFTFAKLQWCVSIRRFGRILAVEGLYGSFQPILQTLIPSLPRVSTTHIMRFLQRHYYYSNH